MKTKLSLTVTLFLPSLIGTAQQDDYKVIGHTDYTKVDCNATTTRQTMLREYNARYAREAGSKVIDVLDQKRKSATSTSVECYGTYSFADGTTKKILYKEMINSLGKTVWTFTPDSW